MGIQDVRYAMGWPGSGNTRREWYEGLATGSTSGSAAQEVRYVVEKKFLQAFGLKKL